MTHNHTHESAAGETAAPSGQTSGLDRDEYTTTFPTLQHRVGHIRLKARIPGACISLQLPGPVQAQLLTIEEARALIGALASLIADIEADARSRNWSKRLLDRMVAAADASAESYDSL